MTAPKPLSPSEVRAEAVEKIAKRLATWHELDPEVDPYYWRKLRAFASSLITLMPERDRLYPVAPVSPEPLVPEKRIVTGIATKSRERPPMALPEVTMDDLIDDLDDLRRRIIKLEGPLSPPTTENREDR